MRTSLDDEEISLLVEYLYHEQTRAGVEKPDPPAQLESIDYTIGSEIWVDNLDLPWAIVFLNRIQHCLPKAPGKLRMIVEGKLVD